jgi:hypothetical protein
MDKQEFKIDITIKELVDLVAMFDSKGYDVYRRVLADLDTDIIDGAKTALGAQSMGGYQGQMILMDEFKSHEGEFRKELEDRKAQDVVV